MKKKNLLLFSLSISALMALASCGCGNGGGGGGGGTDSSQGGGGDTSEVSGESKESGEGGGDYEDVDYHGIVRVYYHNDANNYASKRIWAWCKGVDGQEYPFANQTKPDDYGVYCDFDLSKGIWAGSISTTFSFIIKEAGTWSGQSTDTICPFGKYISDVKDGILTIYACDGEGGNIDTYVKKDDALGDRLATAYFKDWKTIHVEGGGVQGSRKAAEVGKIDSYDLYAYDAKYEALSAEEKVAQKSKYLVTSGKGGKNKMDITIPESALDKNGLIKPYLSYTIEAKMSLDTSRTKSKVASVSRLFDTTEFVNNYTYSGKDLGATVNTTDGSCTFKLWAPTSSRVQVKIYGTGTPGDIHDEFVPSSNWGSSYEMKYGSKGVWSAKVTDTDFNDASPYYYTYIVTNSNGTVETIDPYAVGCGINGVRGAVISWDKMHKPEGWDNIKSGGLLKDIDRPNQLTVYESHIRDLTMDSTWGGTERPGTYPAYIQEGTKYNQAVTTGFDHIKELGVNAVQLLPVFDADNDERWADENGHLISERDDFGKEKIAPAYNWNYNPLNYNCVEGAYSTNPFDAPVRIKEFRNLVQACANNNIRVIMDVVYNHFASINGNPLQKVVPGYYLRTMEDGSYYDGTGCGNVTATERKMMSKFIVDSCVQWATNYKVKGFRFDLMGCIDVKTMQDVKKALYDVDPDIVVYGEGWAGLGDAGFYSTVNNKSLYKDLRRASLSGVYKYLGNCGGKGSVGCFSNGFRNAMKGDTTNDIYPEWGFLSTGSDNMNSGLKDRSAQGLLGRNIWNYEDNCWWESKEKHEGDTQGWNAEQTVNYVACHDNYGLFDQLNYAIYSQKDADKDTNNADVKGAVVAAQAATLMNEGIAFLQGGDEILRQKVLVKPTSSSSEADKALWKKMEESQKGRTEGHDWLEGDGIKMNSGNYLVRNAYQYGDKVSAYKWDRKVKYAAEYNAVKAAVAERQALINQGVLGKKYSEMPTSSYYNYGGDKGGCIIAARMGDYIVAVGGRQDNPSMTDDDFAGSYTVVYSSGGHDKGSAYNPNKVIGVNKFEVLVLKKA